MSETSIFNSNNKEKLPDDLRLEYKMLCDKIDINEIEKHKNHIINYATNRHIDVLVEFLENPGWMGTIQKLDEIERAVKYAAIDKFNANRCGYSFDINEWNDHIIKRFG